MARRGKAFWCEKAYWRSVEKFGVEPCLSLGLPYGDIVVRCSKGVCVCVCACVLLTAWAELLPTRLCIAIDSAITFVCETCGFLKRVYRIAKNKKTQGTV